MEITRDVFNRLCVFASKVKDSTASAEFYNILRQAEKDLKEVPKEGDDPVGYLPPLVQIALTEEAKKRFRDRFVQRNRIWCIKIIKEAAGLGLYDAKVAVDNMWPPKHPIPQG